MVHSQCTLASTLCILILQRSDVSQPESPRQDRLRTNPHWLVMGSGERRREDGSGAHSDGGLPAIEEPIPSKVC